MKRYALPLKILLGFLAILALTIFLLAWRLSIGPIALDWVGVHLRTALASQQGETTFDFRDAVLIWRTEEAANPSRTSGLQIIFYEVEIRDKKTNFTLNIPEAAARFSGLAMVRGLMAPTDVEFSGLTIEYDLDPKIWQKTDNRPFMEKLEETLRRLQKSNNIVVKTAQRLLISPNPSDVTGYLQQVSLLDTTINLKDQLSGKIWQIPSADLGLRRTDQGFMINLFGDIALGEDNLMPLDMSLLYNNNQKRAVTTIDFSGLRPSALAGEVEALSGLSDLNIPANGTLQFSVDENFSIPVMAFHMALGQGHINPNNLYEKPLPISSAALKGYIQKSESSIVLEEFQLNLGETHIQGSGLLYGSLDTPGVAIKADIADLPFMDLKSYWPGEIGKGAYLWISQNVDAGIVPAGQLEAYITPEMWAEKELPPNAVTFAFDFQNITAHYLRPMPVLTNMSGQAKLNLHEFSLTAEDGKIDDLKVTKADLLFTEIHKKGQGTAYITVHMDGPLEEVLRVIDYKPLGYPSRYGIKPGSIKGASKATVKLEFPLIRKIKLTDVKFDVRAEVTELSIPRLTDNLRLSDGVMDLHVDGDTLTSVGAIRLNDIDFTATWQENFDKQAEYPSQYALAGIVEGAQWEQLHLPFDPYIEGPVTVEMALFGKGGTMQKGQGTFNLTNSRSIFVPLGWDKNVGESGSASFDLTFNGLDDITLSNVSLQSPGLQAELGLDVVEGWITRFDIARLTMEKTDFALTMSWDAAEKFYDSKLSGAALDAIPLIEIITAPRTGAEQIVLPDFNLTAAIENVQAKNDVTLKDVALAAQYRTQDFTHVTLSGTQGTQKKLSITIAPKEENRELTFASTDAGEALRGLGLFNIGVGGDMLLTADMVNHEHGVSLGGHAKVKDFKVIESPEFSKLLEEKKFQKAQEELKKSGLTFSSFDMEFRQYNGVMEISKGRASGPMLGMTIEGAVDQSYDELSIKGTIIPAYGINSLLGNIPLIGTILTGGKGQGIFAATYAIKGSLDKPEIKINPLAALAPGILRTIFSAIGGSKDKTMREKAEELEKVIPNTPPTDPK
ncbi:AsmA-like C-terminal domain-containing protein [Paremcibacter congregatus]|uniref:YhdP family protein n=1 Tax=Paremcibacter congregatus TaxID=2043170 RepID=UPI0030EC2950